MTRPRFRAFEHRGHASRGRPFQSAVLPCAAIIIFLLFGPALTLGQEESEADVAPEAVSEAQGPTSNATQRTEPEPGAVPPANPQLAIERMRLGFQSLWFTTVPLLLGILVIISAIWRHQDRDRFTPYFGEGQFLQLVVIVLVAGNVCSLAIMDILGGSEVAAIYGGIVGYVLGRRATAGTREEPAKTPAPSTPARPPEPR